MIRVRLILEYDGSYFHGWQRQPDVESVQSALEDSLKTILRMDSVSVIGSGRTDAGVHAKGQVAVFDYDGDEIDLGKLSLSISSILRGKLSVVSASIVPLEFHPRFSAIGKEYRYCILNRSAPAVLDRGKVWHVSDSLCAKRLQELASQCIGRHDFEAFRAADCNAKSTVRNISKSEFQSEPPYLIYTVQGEGFLKHMVRVLVGTMVDIAREKIEADSLSSIIESQDRSRAGVTAPPEGLSLEQVFYSDDAA